MILLQLLLADFKRLWAAILLLVLLIASTFALNIIITLQEQGLRVGSARAAAPFDLVIGAPGSETQLVLSSVFLQSGKLPLISMDYQNKLQSMPQVAWSVPLAFGDSYNGLPIIGTQENLFTKEPKRNITQGRIFDGDFEAVVGSKTGLNINDKIIPMHGHGETATTEHHDHVSYNVVGILPEQNSSWDNAIFVPIETVWDIHGIEHHQHEHHENENENEHEHSLAKASVLLVKPTSIAAAYQLRSQFRNEQTLAVFPGEVLSKLYSTLGDVQKLLAVILLCTQWIIGFAIILLSIVYVHQRQRDIAILRIFGAPRSVIFLMIWLVLMLIIMIGLVVGLGLGFIASQIIAYYISLSGGFDLPIFLTSKELEMMLSIIGIAAPLLLIPALISYRVSPLQHMNN